MAENSTQAAIVKFEQSLEGGEIAKTLSIALFSLAIYEHAITFDREVKYFWTGRWTASRILFLLNRYLPPFVMMLAVACFSVLDPPPTFCNAAIHVAFALNFVAVGIIQGILVIRIWYLFQGSRIVQVGVILSFLLSIVTSSAFLYLSTKNLTIIRSDTIRRVFPNIRNDGCRAVRPPLFWRVYLPPLLLHTLIYILTATRALRNRRLLRDAPVLKRLLRDGGFFYFVVFVSVGFTAVGSFLNDLPKINIPAIYSHFMLSTTSIAVSRVMFSIHSLAAKLGSDSAWLLNNLELSRVKWRTGAHEGELIVEWGCGDDEESADSHVPTINNSLSVRVTRVGVFDDRTW